MLTAKFHALTRHHWSESFRSELLARLPDADTMQHLPVPEFMNLLRAPS